MHQSISYLKVKAQGAPQDSAQSKVLNLQKSDLVPTVEPHMALQYCQQ